MLTTLNRLVFVLDPTDSGDYVILIGKQTLHPSQIFYMLCSGIWQSVWIESAPANYITQLDVAADIYIWWWYVLSASSSLDQT